MDAFLTNILEYLHYDLIGLVSKNKISALIQACKSDLLSTGIDGESSAEDTLFDTYPTRKKIFMKQAITSNNWTQLKGFISPEKIKQYQDILDIILIRLTKNDPHIEYMVKEYDLCKEWIQLNEMKVEELIIKCKEINVKGINLSKKSSFYTLDEIQFMKEKVIQKIEDDTKNTGILVIERLFMIYGDEFSMDDYSIDTVDSIDIIIIVIHLIFVIVLLKMCLSFITTKEVQQKIGDIPTFGSKQIVDILQKIEKNTRDNWKSYLGYLSVILGIVLAIYEIIYIYS